MSPKPFWSCTPALQVADRHTVLCRLPDDMASTLVVVRAPACLRCMSRWPVRRVRVRRQGPRPLRRRRLSSDAVGEPGGILPGGTCSRWCHAVGCARVCALPVCACTFFYASLRGTWCVVLWSRSCSDRLLRLNWLWLSRRGGVGARWLTDRCAGGACTCTLLTTTRSLGVRTSTAAGTWMLCKPNDMLLFTATLHDDLCAHCAAPSTTLPTCDNAPIRRLCGWLVVVHQVPRNAVQPAPLAVDLHQPPGDVRRDLGPCVPACPSVSTWCLPPRGWGGDF
jgi:hypothetical protein